MNDASMALIYFKNVSKVYDQNAALEGVTLKIEPKEFVSIVGRSGAGKSTMFKLLLAEEKPTAGKVYFDGQDVARLRPHQLPYLRRRIGVVFQDFRLLPKKTAYENVAFAMEAAGYPEKDIKRDVPEVLELVGIADRARNFPHELSGGEKQRVAIARALVQRPDVITADEPTGNLDPINAWEILRLLVKINEYGTAVILATHNKDLVDAVGRRVVLLDRGKVISDEEKGKYVLA
jgi:cell division transport system ATP-binding protein